MNKIIFQIGLLAFCVTAVVYASMGMDIVEIIAKAFVVFIATIGALLGVVFVASMMTVKPKETNEAEKLA
ncbi:MAG: hypothetical protein H3C35_01010 [Bacteroidetes bacterium]|nr:hypothetical protein [Bacteroidota bacterium]